MATMNLLKYRNQIRSALNQGSENVISTTVLNTIINDGYKDVCCKSLCYESRIDKPNISSALKLISLVGLNIIKINYLEYYTFPIGIQKITPSAAGHLSSTDKEPLYWFQWGDYLYIDPGPDVSTYDLYLYSSIYPPTILSADSDAPAIPVEFHEDILSFSLAFSCLKLKRYSDMIYYYNQYTASVQGKRKAYISKRVDPKFIREPIDTVIMVNPAALQEANQMANQRVNANGKA
jgi:hypothetical protein